MTERVLFVGDDWEGSNATSLRDGFIANGHEVATVNSMRPAGLRSRIATRVAESSRRGHQQAWATALNRRIFHVAKAWRPSVLFVFKGIDVFPEILASVSTLRVHYHPDDSASESNVSAAYRSGENLYHVHITTKKHNVPELEGRTSSLVVYVDCAFDPRWHFPIPTAFQPRLGFVGTMRPDRIELISRWAQMRQPSPMLIAGERWRRVKGLRSTAILVGPQYGVDMALAIARAPIQLGALNSDNRDTHTCRTFEIPACRGLFVGRSTAEHRDMFKHGRDALLWASEDESVEHARWALDRPAEAQQIAAKGHARIMSGYHTYTDRARQILSALPQ